MFSPRRGRNGPSMASSFALLVMVLCAISSFAEASNSTSNSTSTSTWSGKDEGLFSPYTSDWHTSYSPLTSPHVTTANTTHPLFLLAYCPVFDGAFLDTRMHAVCVCAVVHAVVLTRMNTVLYTLICAYVTSNAPPPCRAPPSPVACLVALFARSHLFADLENALGPD